ADIIKVDTYPLIGVLETKFVDKGVPKQLAELISRIGAIPQLLDVAMLARETKRTLTTVATNYFYIGRVLRMDWLRKNVIALPENNKWQALSRSALLADGYTVYSTFIKNAITSTDSLDENFAQTWINKEP